MFIPGSVGNLLRRADLAKIEESIWYPDIGPPSPTPGSPDPVEIGLNLGVQIATAVEGKILAICYWRWSDLQASNGTVALFIADNTLTAAPILVMSKNFIGHTGTGWKRVEFDEPVDVSATHTYMATVWLPQSSDGNVHYGGTRYYFPTSASVYSENRLVWAWPNGGQPFPPHGIYKYNGWYKYGAFDCPNEGVAATNYWVDVVLLGSPAPAPPDPPIVLKWEIPAGYPNLSNTGIPPGTVLTPVYGDLVSTADGDIFEDLDITDGGINIIHHNCIVRRCKIYYRGFRAISIPFGITGTVIEDCDINSGFRSNTSANGIGGVPRYVRRCNIYRGENGFIHYGTYGTGTEQQIYEDNFIHSLRCSGEPHYDCFQMSGGQSHVLFRHNTLHNEHSDTGATFCENIAGPLTDITYEDNVLCGGGFTMYVVSLTDDPSINPFTDFRIINNKLHIGAHGYILNNGTLPEMAGNKLMDHGEIYDAAPPDGFTAGQTVRECFFGMPNGAGTVPGSVASDAVPGLTLGLSFTVVQDTNIVGVNIPKIRTGGETITYKVGVWRFTGANRTAGTTLLYQETIDFTSGIREGWEHLALTTPVAVEAGDNILLGVWRSPGADGRIWFTVSNGVFGSNVMSQFGRATAFNGAGVPLNGFTGGNGLFNYGSDLAPPLSQTGSRPNYHIDPIFEAPWSVVVNEPPTAINLSAAESYAENTPLNLINIVASDPDSANVTAILTLSNPAAGSLNTATSGSVTSTYNAGTGIWVASGAIANVNTLLAGVIFTPTTGFIGSFSIVTSVSDGIAPPITGTKPVTCSTTPTPAGSIPLTYGDPRFADNTPSSDVAMSSGTLFKKSITVTGSTASIIVNGSVIIDTCRVDSAECVRMAGNVVDIRNSYLEATGSGDDHADTIQAYDPGQHSGQIKVKDSSIVAHTTAATAGLFVADDWGGTVTLENVVFNGGPFGLRLHADPGCTLNVSLKDVFFVGPFGYEPFMLEPVGSGVLTITKWENVRHATIVGGVLVPGALIEEP